MSGGLKMSVNVSLCGSIPRSQMNFCSTQKLRELDSNSHADYNRLQNCISTSKNLKTPCMNPANMENSPDNRLPRKVSCEEINASSLIAPTPPPIIEAPAWAVAAKGAARLEPACESINVQTPIDLTKQAVFRVGRSQNSDVQLLHCTSSRKHAILFHHPNGSCYVVDCGSAYGTFINGVRVSTAMQQNEDNGSSGIILPHKVKRGSIIRFGGPGAPTFILKSFSVGLDTLVKNLKETNKTSICVCGLDEESAPENCITKENNSEMSSAALLALNTRLNAEGNNSSNILSSRGLSSSLSSAQLYSRLQPQTQSSTISFLKKRSVVSFDEDNDLETEMPSPKRHRTFAAQSLYEYPPSDAAIVSPTRQQKPTLQLFNFESIDRPVVSPTPSDEHASLVKVCSNLLEVDSKSILRTPLSLPSSLKKNRRVRFNDADVVRHPRKVSTDESG